MLERFAAARRAGFAAVEIQFPYDHDPGALKAAKDEAGVELVLINMPAGDPAAGGRGLAALPGREAEFRASLDEALRYAAALDCRQIHPLAGVTANGADHDAHQAVLAENLTHAAEAAERAGVRVLVEAINSRDTPGYILDTADKALAAIDRAGHPNLYFQCDVYHLQAAGGDALGRLDALLGRTGHIQFADHPGRHEPGSGEIDFSRVFDALDNSGYEGWVGAEYNPSGTTEDSLGWFAPWRT